MCKENELVFLIFILYSLADKWNKTPAVVYNILNSTGILDNYVTLIKKIIIIVKITIYIFEMM